MKLIKNAIYSGAEKRESLYDLTFSNTGSEKVIIFIHGYMGYKDWGCWNLVSDFFVDKGYSFLKYNVSHNGGTIEQPIDFNDLNAFENNSYTKEIQDFEAILRIVEDKFKDPEIYIIGHSRGGGIALLQSKSAKITKIASWAGISSIENRFPKGEDLEIWQQQGKYVRKNGRTHQEMPHSYNQFLDFTTHKDRLNIENYCLTSTTPTIVIHGEQDQSVLLNESENIANWLNTQLVVIPETAHTFGSKQPYIETAMPTALTDVCIKTLNFFNQ